MSTYARSTTALTATRGRSQSWPMAFQDASEVAISLVGATITTRITWQRHSAIALSVGSGITVTNAAGGLFTVAVTADQFAELPEGQLSEVSVEIVDTSGASFVFEYPLTGQIR